MGEHHCTVCTILSREWWRGGAGFDGPQIMSFLRVCQQLSPGQFGGARSEARCEAETLFFFSGFHCPIGGRVWSQVSGADPLNVRPDLAVFPQVCMFPSPSTATLATEGQEEHSPVRTKKKKRRKSTGWLLTEVQATSNSPSVPALAVVSPDLLKHSFWSETPWSLIADHFTPAFAIPALLKMGAIGQMRPSWALGTYWVIFCGSLASIRDQDFS